MKAKICFFCFQNYMISYYQLLLAKIIFETKFKLLYMKKKVFNSKKKYDYSIYKMTDFQKRLKSIKKKN